MCLIVHESLNWQYCNVKSKANDPLKSNFFPLCIIREVRLFRKDVPKMQLYCNTRYMILECLTVTTVRIHRIRNCSGNKHTVELSDSVCPKAHLCSNLVFLASSHYMALYTSSSWCELTTSCFFILSVVIIGIHH